MSTTRTQTFPCACCGGTRCCYEFTSHYDTTSCAFTTPTLLATQCGSSDGEPLNTWIYDTATSAHYWACTSSTCTSAGDCTSPPAAPAAPPAPSGTGRCMRQWTAQYACESETWTGPTDGGVSCQPTGTTTGSWTETMSDSSGCSFVYFQDLSQCCTSDGDCSTTETSAPALPDSSGCDCGSSMRTTCDGLPDSCASTVTVTISGSDFPTVNGSHVCTWDGSRSGWYADLGNGATIKVYCGNGSSGIVWAVQIVAPFPYGSSGCAFFFHGSTPNTLCPWDTAYTAGAACGFTPGALSVSA